MFGVQLISLKCFNIVSCFFFYVFVFICNQFGLIDLPSCYCVCLSVCGHLELLLALQIHWTHWSHSNDATRLCKCVMRASEGVQRSVCRLTLWNSQFAFKYVLIVRFSHTSCCSGCCCCFCPESDRMQLHLWAGTGPGCRSSAFISFVTTTTSWHVNLVTSNVSGNFFFLMNISS